MNIFDFIHVDELVAIWFVIRLLLTITAGITFGIIWCVFVIILGPILWILGSTLPKNCNFAFDWSDHIIESNEFWLEPMDSIWRRY